MFNFQTYQADRLQRMEEFLQTILPSENTPPLRLHKAMRYATLSAGKRIRPVLCLAACELVGGTITDALYPAAAVELFHTYTLIHDDLPAMDNDDFRRGKPSCHKAFDEATAILTGDALQALAFECIAKTPAQQNVSPLLQELGYSAGSIGVAGGQAEEMELDGANPSREILERIHYRKTALLIRCAVRMGAMAGNASLSQLDALTIYGTSLGMAFQITDDILDSIQDQPLSTSATPAAGNMTCLSILSMEEAVNLAVHHRNAAIHALSQFPAEPAAPLAAIANLVHDRILPVIKK